MFPLPDRDDFFEAFNGIAGGGEGIFPMGGSDNDSDRNVAHPQGADPVDEGDFADRPFLSHLVDDAPQFPYRLTLHALAGRTIGKALLRLQVTDQQGHPCGLWRALIRKVFFVLSSLCACGVGLFWAGFDPYKQGWHDLIAGTVVLKGQ